MKDHEKGRFPANKPALQVFVDLRTEEDYIKMEFAREIGRMMEEHYPCGRCGGCCHQDNILILEEDAKEIAKLLGLPPDEFKTKYMRRMEDEWFLKQGRPCPFLDEEHERCNIYQVRPKICRMFPYETPWFIKGVFNILKFGPKRSPPFILYVAEGRPCRQNLMKRVREVTLDFLSDTERMKSAGARGLANFQQRLLMKGDGM
jgi:hypothetical protein